MHSFPQMCRAGRSILANVAESYMAALITRHYPVRYTTYLYSLLFLNGIRFCSHFLPLLPTCGVGPSTWVFSTRSAGAGIRASTAKSYVAALVARDVLIRCTKYPLKRHFLPLFLACGAGPGVWASAVESNVIALVAGFPENRDTWLLSRLLFRNAFRLDSFYLTLFLTGNTGAGIRASTAKSYVAALVARDVLIRCTKYPLKRHFLPLFLACGAGPGVWASAVESNVTALVAGDARSLLFW